MKLESWSDIIRTVMQEKELTLVFGVIYILIATFGVLDRFIAVVVNSMQKNHAEDTQNQDKKIDVINKKLDLIMENLNKNDANFLKNAMNRSILHRKRDDATKKLCLI